MIQKSYSLKSDEEEKKSWFDNSSSGISSNAGRISPNKRTDIIGKVVINDKQQWMKSPGDKGKIVKQKQIQERQSSGWKSDSDTAEDVNFVQMASLNPHKQ